VRLLIKFPIRERRDSFRRAFDLYCDLSVTQPAFLITIDDDDRTMNKPSLWEHVHSSGFDVTVKSGPPAGKVAACNRDLLEYDQPWDVVLLASDDMHPIVQGYDQIILDQMHERFPDNDGALWFQQPPQDRVNFVEIQGRKRVEEKGYIYHPSYKSLFCDNEETDKGIRDGKLAKVDIEIIRNMSPDWHPRAGAHPRDRLYQVNNRFYPIDQQTFNQRQATGFP
jgi:hypothetical protein